MQLIAEAETTLELEKMSTIENIQTNKLENLGDLNKKKCNGNKEVTTIAEKDSNKQVIIDIVESAAVTAVNRDFCELSNVDLTEIITKANDTQIKESQNNSSEYQTNDLNTTKNENVSKDIQEEDDLEDDIISINERPFTITSQPQEPKESAQTSIIEETNNCEKDTIEIIDDANETPVEIGRSLSIRKDVIKVIEELKEFALQCAKTREPSKLDVNDELGVIDNSKDSPIQQVKEKVQPMEIEDEVEFIEESEDLCEQETKEKMREQDDIEVTKESEHPGIQREKEIEQPMQEEQDDELEVIEEIKDSPIQHEREIEQPIQEEQDEIGAIEGSIRIHSQFENQTKQLTQNEQKENDSIETVEDSFIRCEKEIEPSVLEKKIEIVDTVDLGSFTLCEPKKDSPPKELPENESDPIEESNESVLFGLKNIDQTMNSEQANETVVQCEKKSDLITEEVKESSAIGENKEVEVRKESAKPEQCYNNSESSLKTIKSTVEIETQVNNTTNSTETFKYNFAGEISNTDVITDTTNNDITDIEDNVKKPKNNMAKVVDSSTELRENMDVEQAVKETTSSKKSNTDAITPVPANIFPINKVIDRPIICKLSNTLDILSDDDEEELPKTESTEVEPPKEASSNVNDVKEKQCIDLEDDDDIMVIDEDTSKIESGVDHNKEEISTNERINTDSETGEKTVQETKDLSRNTDEKESTPNAVNAKADPNMEIDIKEKSANVKETDKSEPPTALLPDNFLTSAKKKLSDMTREELEEFCILKIVESLVDRSSLSDIKNKLKSVAQGLEDHRRKAMMLTKQNRDLQVVLKSVQEEQKKATGDTPITPLKITRSVGMQVFMEKTVPRKKGQQPNANKTPQNKNVNAPAGPRPQKQATQSIPVPRLVPAFNPALKTPSTIPQVSQVNITPKTNSPNGLIRTPSPAMKAEKRQHVKISTSITVDLTDDEPPTKMAGGPRASPAPPVRLVSPQNLMAPPRQPFGAGVNSPRKVYIPISGPQNQSLRPGQTIMLKTVPTPVSGIRPRLASTQVTRVDPNSVRMNRVATRHPAPLPFAMKQYQPPNWKALPPAPDLKLSKVENGIVISWKIEGIPEDSYEEIASYQLYAYQETSTPPSTALWKKIGDVKALPLPMACTLTQFMAGYKYYFAVRAVDIRSRLGPFSLPGSILLLSKNI